MNFDSFEDRYLEYTRLNSVSTSAERNHTTAYEITMTMKSHMCNAENNVDTYSFYCRQAVQLNCCF